MISSRYFSSSAFWLSDIEYTPMPSSPSCLNRTISSSMPPLKLTLMLLPLLSAPMTLDRPDTDATMSSDGGCANFTMTLLWSESPMTLYRSSWSRSLPWFIRATRSQRSETSYIMCDDMKTVRSWFSSLMFLRMSLISAIPLGSRPDVGSSRMTTSGEFSSARPMLILCLIPLENVPMRLSAHSVILTFSRSSEVSAEMDSLVMPRSSPM